MIDFGYGIALDTIETGDLEQMRSWRNNPSIWKWCRQSDIIANSQHMAWFSGHKDKMYTVRDGKKFVGVCGLTSIDALNRRAEFSLYTAPEYQKRGYARAGLKTLFKHGFDNLNLNLIWGETFEGNPALELFKSLGMTVDGVRPQHYFKGGKYINATLVSILRDSYDY